MLLNFNLKCEFHIYSEHYSSCDHTDTWMLLDLPRAGYQQLYDAESDNEIDTISGLEINCTSGTKQAGFLQPLPLTQIEGIGELKTSWIGQEGVQDLSEKYKCRLEADQISQLKEQLKDLAEVCSRALNCPDNQTEVQKALQLCRRYIPCSKGKQRRPGPASPKSSVAKLWLTAYSQEDNMDTEDPNELACNVLGQELIDTILEKHRQPPDVSNVFLVKSYFEASILAYVTPLHYKYIPVCDRYTLGHPARQSYKTEI